MVVEGKLEGKYVYLESADIADAEFTLSLRQDSLLTKYLPRLDISLGQQKEWIKSQRKKDGDYFFVVRANDGEPIGTTSIYNVNGDTSEGGRLALIGDSIQNTEASLLLYRFAFNTLRLKNITGYIVDGNKRADRFNKQFGCVTGEPKLNEKGEMIRETLLTVEAFRRAEERLVRVLYKSVCANE